MTRKKGDRGLEDLAGRINECHGKFMGSVKVTLDHARLTGNLLVRAKEAVKAAGGEWLDWLQKNCLFSPSEAQRYMKIADRWWELLASGADPEKLTMTEALRILSSRDSQARPAAGRIEVASSVEAEGLEVGAKEVELPDTSAGAKFVKGKAEQIARAVLKAARKAKLTIAGEEVGEAQAAVALLAIREAL